MTNATVVSSVPIESKRIWIDTPPCIRFRASAPSRPPQPPTRTGTPAAWRTATTMTTNSAAAAAAADGEKFRLSLRYHRPGWQTSRCPPSPAYPQSGLESRLCIVQRLRNSIKHSICVYQYITYQAGDLRIIRSSFRRIDTATSSGFTSTPASTDVTADEDDYSSRYFVKNPFATPRSEKCIFLVTLE